MGYKRNVDEAAHQAESGIRRAVPDALDGFVQFVRRYPLVVGAITYAGLFGLLAATKLHRHE